MSFRELSSSTFEISFPALRPVRPFEPSRARANIAGLYTIIATCEARGINPFAYLSDVLTRVQAHPAKRLHELLPSAWEPRPA